MNLSDASKLAYELLKQHGLFPYWGFRFNNRRRAVGLCRKFRQVKYIDGAFRIGTIELERTFTLTATNADIRDTLLHEIAHAIAGVAAGHGKEWQETAARIGCSPEGCKRVSHQISGQRNTTGAKLKASCPKCGKDYFLYRMPKQMVGYYCKPCGRESGRLVWKPPVKLF